MTTIWMAIMAKTAMMPRHRPTISLEIPTIYLANFDATARLAGLGKARVGTDAVDTERITYYGGVF